MALSYIVPRASELPHEIPADVRNERAALEQLVDWSRIRRPRPLDRLLPDTIEWGNRLPADIRPTQLMSQYPRVANRLAIAWQDPKAVADVFDDVLVDRRGGRRGFPPVAQAELLSLRSHVQRARSVRRACQMI